jgi:hypothetical protein
MDKLILDLGFSHHPLLPIRLKSQNDWDFEIRVRVVGVGCGKETQWWWFTSEVVRWVVLLVFFISLCHPYLCSFWLFFICFILTAEMELKSKVCFQVWTFKLLLKFMTNCFSFLCYIGVFIFTLLLFFSQLT